MRNLLPTERDLLRTGWASLSRIVLGLIPLVFLLACDGGGAGTGPPPDRGTGVFSFSFETGFEGWLPDSADFCELEPVTGVCSVDSALADTQVDLVQAPVSNGSQAVQLAADNATDAVKVWIERQFLVNPDAEYRVEVSWDLGTSDEEGGSWVVIGAATPFDPSAAFQPDDTSETVGDFLRLGSTQSPTGLFTFVRKSFTRTVQTESRGKIWVGIGVWGTFEVQHEYIVDVVTVRIERVDAA